MLDVHKINTQCCDVKCYVGGKNLLVYIHLYI